MAKTNLYYLLEAVTGGIGTKYNYILPDGHINFSALPAINKIRGFAKPAVPEDRFYELMNGTAPDADGIIKAIADQNFSNLYPNHVFEIFVAINKEVVKAKQYLAGFQGKNAKLNPKYQSLIDLYTKGISEFIGLFKEIYLYKLKNKNNNSNNGNGQQTPPPAPVVLQIKDFKNLSLYIRNTPKFQHITDAVFDDFYDVNNQEAQTYYELMAKGDDTQVTPAGDIGVVYDMFKDMRRQCDITVKSYAALQHQMGAIHNYYGTSGGDSKSKKSKEFYATKALNLHSIKNHDLVRFKYKLLDTDGKPYRGSNVEYLGTFRYYDLRNTYKFINDIDKNNIFEFLSPKPNPINLNTSYNIEYSSLRHTKTQMKIYVTAIEIQKVDAQQDFINCSAVEELKELVRDIRENTK